MNREIEVQSEYWDRESSAFQKIYSHEKSAFSNFLDKAFRQDMYDRFSFTMKHAAPLEGRTFLDVGCGNGIYSVEFASKGAKEVVGIDIADNMLRLCNELSQRSGVADRCKFIHGDLLKFETNDRFDVTIGIGLFDYTSDPLPVLSKMRHITKDKVIASFPRFWTWRAPVRKARLAMRGCDVYFYTRQDIQRLLKKAGFNRSDIQTVGKLYCIIGYCQ